MSDCPPEPERGDATRRIRLARALVGHWQDGTFVLENYLSGTQCTVPVALIDLLGAFDGYFNAGDLQTHCPSLVNADALVEQLLASRLVVQENSPEAAREDLVEKVWKWGTDARFFHFSTNAPAFECNDERVWQALTSLAAEEPPPSPFKDYPGPTIPLPVARPLEGCSLGRALLSRRSRRAFGGTPIACQELADLLWWTWGQTDLIKGSELGDVLLKTSPSGGARHPIEVYPIVLRVEGLEPGVYHYSVRAHALSLLEPRLCEDLAVEICSGQAWLRDTAAVFVMAAVVKRVMWKYHHSHAFRVLHMDAGHLGQTFHLVCTALNLAPFTTAATDNPRIEQILGLDGVREIVLYVAAAGTAGWVGDSCRRTGEVR